MECKPKSNPAIEDRRQNLGAIFLSGWNRNRLNDVLKRQGLFGVGRAQARLQKIADQKAAAEAKEAAERAEAHAAYLERSRRASWVVHNLDAIIAAGNGHEPLDLDRFDASIPKSGWPDNDSPENYPFTGALVSMADEKQTAMHKMAEKLHIKI